MATPEGAWLVLTVRRGHTQWFRILHDDDVIEGLSAESTATILDEAGIDRNPLISLYPGMDHIVEINAAPRASS